MVGEWFSASASHTPSSRIFCPTQIPDHSSVSLHCSAFFVFSSSHSSPFLSLPAVDSIWRCARRMDEGLLDDVSCVDGWCLGKSGKVTRCILGETPLLALHGGHNNNKTMPRSHVPSLPERGNPGWEPVPCCRIPGVSTVVPSNCWQISPS